ncbi:DUF481 domain-containing protein [Metapseudomonas furukawaii]|jgi:hypothetical protein|uniref:Peptide chain release factor RF-3 n=1 Tax=Metapseudomonas furukawaii TaxID=1149133 RepID=A0AAD1BZC1_METFU|nr:DUF481 domain-containing protein [Pseudomonas furukawaii]ELS24338.1 hypothetical protein ppKF707_3513 [Pseudomonas furukawaii]WAG80087.1 DUF481 domain-containing protein [Pseudomonas furukawaii]BAU72714.1 peptide chain release factor RF-3 [Pseudomonas furukawaii]
MLSRSLLCLALAAASTATFADTVWLKNGDRLTGTIRVFDGNKLVLETDYGGTIPLDWKKVATLESDRELLIKQGDVEGERAKSLHRADEGKVILANGDAPKEVELASIDQIMKPKPLVEDLTWTGNVDLALDYKRAEKDTDDYDVDFSTKARHGRWRHNASGEYNREFTNEVKTTDNWEVEYALDRFLTDQFFWQGRGEYKRDKVEELARQRTLGTGPGYQFWDDELGAFSLASLVNRSDYQFSDGSKENFYSLSLKWDYNRYLIGKTVEFFTTGEVGRPLDNTADYSLDAEMGLRYKLTDWASLNMKAEKDQVSGADGEIDETRYTVGFGVGW